MIVSFGLRLENLVVKLVSEFSLDDLSQNISLNREFGFDGNVSENFFVEAVNFTYFQCQSVCDFEFTSLCAIINDL